LLRRLPIRAIPKQYETKLDAKSFGATDILTFVKAHQPTLNQPEHYVGAWSDQGTIYLDVAVRAQKREAAALGRKSGQLAMFNLATGETTWLTRGARSPGGARASSVCRSWPDQDEHLKRK
jgi:hypothetical protein